MGKLAKVTIAKPFNPTWKAYFTKKSNATYMTDNAPNKFHRFMHRILLGIIWEKL